MVVQIQVSDETWKMLKDRKQRPSHTFDEVIREALLEMPEAKENKIKRRPTSYGRIRRK